MDTIKLAGPFTVSSDNNQSVLSVLSGYVPKKKVLQPTLLVPISPQVDISTIVQENNLAITKASKINQGANKNEAHDADSEVFDVQDEDVEPASFVPLSQLSPLNRQEQMTTVLLQGFPSFKRQIVDRILRQLMSLSPPNVPRSFTWSTVLERNIGIHGDRRNVFVKFASLLAIEWLHRNRNVFSDTISDFSIVFDNEIDGSSAEEIPTSSKEELSTFVSKVMLNKSSFSLDLGRTGTEDLDQVMQYYRTYKVENSELVEVPKDMKEVIVRDIINFRSKMLQIERDRRKKEMEKERKNAKARLTQMFEGIREAAIDSLGTISVKDLDMEDNEENSDPLAGLTEEEYQKHIKEEKLRADAAEYNAKLAEMQQLEKSEKQALLDQLALLQNYESNLIENKAAYIDEIKSFDDMDLARANSALSARLQLHYSNHLEYVRLRNIQLAKEEELDALDEKEELESTSNTHLFTLPAQKVNNVVQKQAVDISVANLSAEKLDTIKSKISDLIEEYLGIKENLLIDFIFEHVKEHSLNQRQELIDELQETLDDDSANVVDLLYEHIASLV